MSWWALLGALMVLPVAHAAGPDPELIEQGQRAFARQGCYGCHTIGTTGARLGPDLSLVGAKYRPDYLARWLKDPSYLRPSAHMPGFELTDEDVRSIAAFLATRE
jgi:mono/diheme cytochrome c family protein